MVGSTSQILLYLGHSGQFWPSWSNTTIYHHGSLLSTVKNWQPYLQRINRIPDPFCRLQS